MEKDQKKKRGPIIEKRGGNGKYWIKWRGKESGPWDEMDEEAAFSPDDGRWAVRATLHKRSYVLIDGAKHGPFNSKAGRPWFDPGRKAFVFNTQRGNEFHLIADGRIVRKGKTIEKGNGRTYLHVDGRHYGPFDDVGYGIFSLSGGRWAATAWRGKECWLLLDGNEHGPFHSAGIVEFGPGCESCACRTDHGDGPGLLLNGERFFGPYKDYLGPVFSPDGRRWGMDIEKKGKWHGFVVDGEEFGPFPFQYFFPRFSADGKRWFVVLDGGYEDRPHSFILDGLLYGRYRICEIGFLADGRFVCACHRREKYFIFLDELVLGPFRHEAGDVVRVNGEMIAVMGYVGKGRKKERRVISCYLREQGKNIFFSADGGDSLEAAIVIHNADDTSQGVAAEYQYLRVLLGERKIVYDLTEQQLLQRNGKHYDQLVYQMADGKSGSLFFDITGFFGRFTEEIVPTHGEKDE